jgi:hypothetical protein
MQILKTLTRAVQVAVQVVVAGQHQTVVKIIADLLEAITSRVAQAVCQIS